MREFHIFHILEKLPDGSTIFRTHVYGRFAAERKVQELAEHSMNEFAASDIKTGRSLAELKPTQQNRDDEVTAE
jgi:hypothetical protein